MTLSWGGGNVAQTHLSLKLFQNQTRPMGSHGNLPHLENTGISDEQQSNLSLHKTSAQNGALLKL